MIFFKADIHKDKKLVTRVTGKKNEELHVSK